ncbi:MAG: helix-turn-helix domain-containing protein [Candidatus Omnitrophota bacterium]
MPEEKLLTVREVSSILGVSEKEIIELAEDGKIPAYKVGGVYLRFKKEQVEGMRKSIRVELSKPEQAHAYSMQDKFGDFIYFNDFYIVSVLIIIFMLFIIFRG